MQNWRLLFRERWQEPCGYRDVLQLAFPLILSTSSWTIQSFVDRMFLTWYSAETLAASMPSSIISFTIISFFLGTGSYVSTFVAQYYGAQRPERIGACLWQGIYFAGITAFLFVFLAPATDFIFALVGHNAKLQELEAKYFRILCFGSGLAVYSSVLSSFFSGLGRTWTIMWVNLGATCVNIVFDYLMIFGYGGFPEQGIAGAAWATVFSTLFSSIVFSWLLFGSKKYRQAYGLFHHCRIDRALFKRLMYYGGPNGLQFMLDNLAFTFFIILIGRLGTDELTVTTLAFQINTIAFLPMIGLSIATSILVGQELGANRPEFAVRATWRAFHLTFLYMGTIALCYVILPDLFLWPFAVNIDPVVLERLRPQAIILLRFIAAYSLFDTCNVIFSGTLKGAGDTKFVMYFSLVAGWLVLVAPTYYIISTNGHFLTTWIFVTLYVSLVGLGFLLRFLQGKWKQMRVIENVVVPEVDPSEKK